MPRDPFCDDGGEWRPCYIPWPVALALWGGVLLATLALWLIASLIWELLEGLPMLTVLWWWAGIATALALVCFIWAWIATGGDGPIRTVTVMRPDLEAGTARIQDRAMKEENAKLRMERDRLQQLSTKLYAELHEHRDRLNDLARTLEQAAQDCRERPAPTTESDEAVYETAG